MTSFGAIRVVTYHALDALGRLIVAGVANLPASPFRGLLWGSAKAHLVYVPVTGDQFLLARTSGGVDQPLTGAIDPAAAIAAQTFAAGDIGLRTAVGAIVRVTAAGDLYLTPAPGRAIYLAGGSNNAIGTNATIAISGTVTAPSGGGACTVALTGAVSSGGNAQVKV
jgi:hypothetical protein